MSYRRANPDLSPQQDGYQPPPDTPRPAPPGFDIAPEPGRAFWTTMTLDELHAAHEEDKRHVFQFEKMRTDYEPD